MSTSTIKRGLITRGVATKGLIFESEFAVTGELTSVITSAGSLSVNENIDADTAVYTATARDPNGVTSGFSFAISTGNSSDFTINSSTGVVTIDASPNFEAQPSYSFTVTATKSGQPTATKNVTIGVNNLDDTAPTITSGATATAIAENSGAGQVIYTVTADDSSDISGGVTFSKSGTDQSHISIDSTTGAVTLTANPDFETKSSYSFNVIATDAAGNNSTQAVTLAITDDTSDNGIQHTITHLSQCIQGSSTPYTEANGFCLYGAHWTGNSNTGSYRGGSSVSPDHNSIWGSKGANNANMIQDLCFTTSNYGGYSSSQPSRHRFTVHVAGNHSNNPTNWSVTPNPGVSETFNKADLDINTYQSNGAHFYEWNLGATVPASGTAWHDAKNFTNGNTWTTTFTVL